MSVMEFALFLVTLKTFFNDFAWPLLLYKQSSITWSWRIEKKIMALFIQFHYKTKVYYERTVQVECSVTGFLSKNVMLGKLFQVLMKFISKPFPK